MFIFFFIVREREKRERVSFSDRGLHKRLAGVARDAVVLVVMDMHKSICCDRGHQNWPAGFAILACLDTRKASLLSHWQGPKSKGHNQPKVQ